MPERPARIILVVLLTQFFSVVKDAWDVEGEKEVILSTTPLVGEKLGGDGI